MFKNGLNALYGSGIGFSSSFLKDYVEHVLYGIVAINHELHDAHLH
jgi:hypothetical protein